MLHFLSIIFSLHIDVSRNYFILYKYFLNACVYIFLYVYVLQFASAFCSVRTYLSFLVTVAYGFSYHNLSWALISGIAHFLLLYFWLTSFWVLSTMYFSTLLGIYSWKKFYLIYFLCLYLPVIFLSPLHVNKISANSVILKLKPILMKYFNITLLPAGCQFQMSSWKRYDFLFFEINPK